MLATQHFCVKWNSYSSNLQSMFPRLLTSEHFVDITLACEGQMIKCHKVVLSACSTYFEKLLVQNPCQHPIIFMKDMKHWEVQALVDFMYKGEVNVSQEELNSLLIAAEALQIRGLCGSDNTCRSQQDINSQATTSSVNKLSTVSLPNDIVLSGSPVVPKDSQPQKKRKFYNDEKEQSPSNLPNVSSIPNLSNVPNVTNAANVPRISSVSSGSNTVVSEANSVQSSHPSLDQFTSDCIEEIKEDTKDKNIKLELETEEHFLEGEVDCDIPEEDLGGLEQQEDSDSNNRDDVHTNTVLDQPGPSGISATVASPDKAATGGRWTEPVSTMGSSEVDHCGLPTLQHHSSLEQPQLLEIPFASSWCGNMSSPKQISRSAPLQFSRHVGELYTDPLNRQEISRECSAYSLQVAENESKSSNVVAPLSAIHYSSGCGPASSVVQYVDGVQFPSHTFGTPESTMITRNPLMQKKAFDFLLTTGQTRQHRISRRRTEEEKALRKLEMARLRQRRFRAKIRLMREAGLPVVKKERKRKAGSETDNTQT